MKRGDLDERHVERGFLREHLFEGDPDAVIDTSLYAFGLEPEALQMLPDGGCEDGGVAMCPFVGVDEGLGVVEVAYEVVLGEN